MALSDLIICLNENNLPFLILGKRINQGVEGIFGMLSAMIYLYRLIWVYELIRIMYKLICKNYKKKISILVFKKKSFI